ncbi:hypothetical protein [Halosimplex sp. J119]
MGSRLPVGDRTVSVSGTLLGLGLLLVGVGMAAGAGFELLLASGRPLAGPVIDLWRVPLGVGLAVAGFAVFRSVAGRGGADSSEENGHSEAGTMYVWEF